MTCGCLSWPDLLNLREQPDRKIADIFAKGEDKGAAEM